MIDQIEFRLNKHIPKGVVYIMPKGLMECICIASNMLSEKDFEKYLELALTFHKHEIGMMTNIEETKDQRSTQ